MIAVRGAFINLLDFISVSGTARAHVCRIDLDRVENTHAAV